MGERLKVAIVSEFFPSPVDPILGIWVLRQAQAVREFGIDVHVLALQRPVPPAKTLRPMLHVPPDSTMLKDWAHAYKKSRRSTEVDGVPRTGVSFLAPPRQMSYGSWGLWAAPRLRRALRHLDKSWGFDIVHAHYAAPTGYAVSAWCTKRERPLITSLHGGDLLNTATRSALGRKLVKTAVNRSEVVLCNSKWTMKRARELVASSDGFEVVHLGTDIPEEAPDKFDRPTVVTVANLDPRKRHGDVLRAIAAAAEQVPGLQYVVIGDGPCKSELHDLAAELGIEDRVRFTGRLDHEEALGLSRRCHLFAMPSVDEAFGVAYVEAMAAGLPAIGCLGEGGPVEIESTGNGMVLVPPGDPPSLSQSISEILTDQKKLERLGKTARETVEQSFSWKRCGRQTADVYREVVGSTTAAKASTT